MALTDAGTSALHYLVRHSTDEVELFTEVLTLLLNKGADIDSQNKHGESPLIQASFRGKKQSVDFLLEHHAEVNVTTKYAHAPRCRPFVWLIYIFPVVMWCAGRGRQACTLQRALAERTS